MANRVRTSPADSVRGFIDADAPGYDKFEGEREFQLYGRLESTIIDTIAVYRNGGEALNSSQYKITPDSKLILKRAIANEDEYIEVRSATSKFKFVYEDVLLFPNTQGLTVEEMEQFAPDNLDCLSLDIIKSYKHNSMIRIWLEGFHGQAGQSNIPIPTVGYVLDYHINKKGIYGVLKLESEV